MQHWWSKPDKDRKPQRSRISLILVVKVIRISAVRMMRTEKKVEEMIMMIKSTTNYRTSLAVSEA